MERLSLTCYEAARLRFDLAGAYGLAAEDADARVVDLPVLAYHLDLRGRSVLVDAPAYDEATTPQAYLLPGYPPPAALEDQLRRRGVEPESVTDVIITHAHFDHHGGLTQQRDGRLVPTFPNARHYLGRAEWAGAEPDALSARTLAVVERAGLLRLVEGDVELGEGLELVAAPGESPGHLLVRAALGGDVAYLVGDLYHHESELEHPERDVAWVDRPAMHASKAMLRERAAREGARVYFSHIAGAYRALREGDGYRWAAEPIP